MGMSFNEIPDNQLVPFVYVEFDSSKAVAGPGVMSYKGLLIGNMLSTGTADPNVPRQISSVAQAEELFGRGSLLANQARAWFKNNESTELWAIGLDDDGAGVAATGDFNFSGTATESGTVSAYIGGKKIKVAVTSGDTASTVATAFKAELDKDENSWMPVSNHVSSGRVYLHLRNAGEFGNDLDLRLNHQDGEKLPAGLSCSVTQPASGANNPDIQDAIDAMGSEQYHIISHPFVDDTNMDLMEDELLDRWGPLTQNDGVQIVYKEATYANLGTYADSRNSQFSVVMGGYNTPSPQWEIAASVAASVAKYAQIDRGRPFQTLKLKGIVAPKVEDRFTQAERNLLLLDGIATFAIASGDVVQIERLVTTYLTNGAGAPDVSYRDLNSVLILSYLRWDWRNTILRKYPRSKLASDGTRYAPGQAIVTPKIMKAEAILKYTEWESIGLVENFQLFKENLVVERNESDPNRLDVLLPPDLINQLIVTATQIQFRL